MKLFLTLSSLFFLFNQYSCTKPISSGHYINQYEVFEINDASLKDGVIVRRGITKIGSLSKPTEFNVKKDGENLKGFIDQGILKKKVQISKAGDDAIKVSMDNREVIYNKFDLKNVSNETVPGSEENFEKLVHSFTRKDQDMPEFSCTSYGSIDQPLREKIYALIEFTPVEKDGFSKTANLFATSYQTRVERPEQKLTIELKASADDCGLFGENQCLKAGETVKIEASAPEQKESIGVMFHRFHRERSLENDREIHSHLIASRKEFFEAFVCDWNLKKL